MTHQRTAELAGEEEKVVFKEKVCCCFDPTRISHSDAISRLTLSHVELGELERATSFSELQVREWFRCFSAQCPTGRMDKEVLVGRAAKKAMILDGKSSHS